MLDHTELTDSRCYARISSDGAHYEERDGMNVRFYIAKGDVTVMISRDGQGLMDIALPGSVLNVLHNLSIRDGYTPNGSW